VKRYRGEVRVYWQEGAKVEMCEDPSGEWVKWSDIEKLRSKLIEEFSVNVANGKKAWIKKLFSSFENIK